MPDPVITDLPELLSRPNVKLLANRILSVNRDQGVLFVPDSMKVWVAETFKDVDIERQTIVRVRNKILEEETLFNSIRALRPMHHRPVSENADVISQSSSEPFAKPEQMTPTEEFGRIRGSRAITAGNVAKYDVHHGLVIFSSVNPYDYSSLDILDFWDVTKKWFKASHETDKSAKYPFIIWNCLWRSGASLVHGHWQLMLARHNPYESVARVERAARAYKKKYKSDFFADYASLHEKLGLGIKVSGAKAYAHLCAKKEKEIIIQSSSPEKLFSALSVVLTKLSSLGVESFNMAVYCPPYPWKSKQDWSLPWVARIVDRGPLTLKASDIASMELFAASVVASDPFALARAMR